jgi:hypothetical protein
VSTLSVSALSDFRSVWKTGIREVSQKKHHQRDANHSPLSNGTVASASATHESLGKAPKKVRRGQCRRLMREKDMIFTDTEDDALVHASQAHALPPGTTTPPTGTGISGLQNADTNDVSTHAALHV